MAGPGATESSPDRTADEVVAAEAMAGVPLARSCGQRVLHPSREQLPEVVHTLREDGWLMCLDVCGVDYLTYDAPRGLPDGIEAERFEVVVTLISHTENDRVRLRVQVPEGDPTVPSLFEIHPGTEAMEREVFDMFGVRFEGHPDLTRILMPEDWDGHPLRKDFATGRIPVQFKAPVGR